MIQGLAAFLVAVMIVRLRRSVVDGSFRDRVSSLVAGRALRAFSASLERAGHRVEPPHPFAREFGQMMTRRLRIARWTPALLAFTIQWVFGPTPWLPGAALGGVYVFFSAMSTAIDSRHGYRPYGGDRTRLEWAVLVPALVLQIATVAFAFVLAWEGISGWDPDDVLGSLVPVTLSVIVLGLGHTPVRFIDRWGRRLRTPVFASDAPEDCNLFLRSFADDDVRLDAPMDAGYLGGPMLALTRPRFEEFVTAMVAIHGPMLAIGRPGERLPELGATRTYWSDDDWQSAVVTTAHRAERIVLVAGLTGGLSWEIGVLRSLGMLQKALVLIPPGPKRATQRRVERAIADLGIGHVDLTDFRPGFLTAIGFDADGSARFYTAAARTWIAYAASLSTHRTILHGRDDRDDHDVTFLDRRVVPRERRGAIGSVLASRKLAKGKRALSDGDHASAIEALREGLEYERAGSSLRYLLRALLVDSLQESGAHDEAITVLWQIVEAARQDAASSPMSAFRYQIGIGVVLASEAIVESLQLIAVIQEEVGNLEARLEVLDELVREARETDSAARAWAMREKAIAALEAERYESARDFARAAVEDSMARSDACDTGEAQLLLAAAHEGCDEHQLAVEAMALANELFERAGDKEWQSEAQRRMGRAKADQGDLESAVHHLIEGLRLAKASNNDFVYHSCSRVLERVGMTLLDEGKVDLASFAARALEDLDTSDEPDSSTDEIC